MIPWSRTTLPVACVLAVVTLSSCGAEKTEATEVFGATQAGERALDLRFAVARAEGCGQYDSTEVREDAATVTVLVLVKSPTARDCPGDALQIERSVVLQDPLSGRTLVDGSTGRPIAVRPA